MVMEIETLFDKDHIITRDDCIKYRQYLRIKADVGLKYGDVIPTVNSRRHKYCDYFKVKRDDVDQNKRIQKDLLYKKTNKKFLKNRKKALEIFNNTAAEIKKKAIVKLSISESPHSTTFCSINFDTYKEFKKYNKWVLKRKYKKSEKSEDSEDDIE